MKVCSCCKVLQNFDQFIKKSSNKDGLYVYCKSCNKKKKEEYYNKYKEKINEKRKTLYKERSKNLEFVLNKRSKNRDWKLNNKGKVNYNTAQRRAKKLKSAISNWGQRDLPGFNEFAIKEIYSLAKLRSECTGVQYEVDHIVPLRSDIVSGLHVYNNLQILTFFENRSKGNKL